MCLIIMQPVDTHVPPVELKTAYENNPDGIGYAFVRSGRVITRRYVDDFPSFVGDYYADHARYGSTSPFLIHFRLATQGSITPANCHPFPALGGVFAHNGVFSDLPGSALPKESDTRHFARTILSCLPRGWKNDPLWCHILDGYIGFNKLAFLWRDGTFTIINERAGLWEANGAWYSNRSHKQSCYWYTPTTVTSPGSYVGGIAQTHDDEWPDSYGTSYRSVLLSDEEIEFYVQNGDPDDLDNVASMVGDRYLADWCDKNGFQLTTFADGGLEVKRRKAKIALPVR